MRALRRHHRARLLAKRKRLDYWGKKLLIENEDDMQWWQECMAAAVNTPHPCSKECCGNPRRYYHEPKRTVQERRHYQETIHQRIAG